MLDVIDSQGISRAVLAYLSYLGIDACRMWGRMDPRGKKGDHGRYAQSGFVVSQTNLMKTPSLDSVYTKQEQPNWSEMKIFTSIIMSNVQKSKQMNSVDK
jgi:hypothetical protein